MVDYQKVILQHLLELSWDETIVDAVKTDFEIQNKNLSEDRKPMIGYETCKTALKKGIEMKISAQKRENANMGVASK